MITTLREALVRLRAQDGDELEPEAALRDMVSRSHGRAGTLVSLDLAAVPRRVAIDPRGPGVPHQRAYKAYRATRPDVVVMDLSLPGPGGLDAVRHIRQWDRRARVLVLTMHANPAFEAGATGYATKSGDPRRHDARERRTATEDAVRVATSVGTF